MSTIPLTLVEGPIALPRVRPLGHLPAPFGRDWALLPPGHSWRTELKALYAAMLRTFCMSDKAILSFCRWVPLNPRRAAAAASAATAKRATVFAPPRDEAPHVFAEAAALPMAEGPAVGTLSRGAPPHWRALAGGACALSGAAMLAWIAFGHLAHRQLIDDVKPADTVTASLDAQPAKPPQHRLSDAVTTREPAAGKGNARTRSAASARVGGAPIYAPAPNQTRATAARRASTNDTLSHRRHALRETTDSRREKARRYLAHGAAANPLSQIAAMSDDMPRIAVPPVAQRASPRPSAAGSYSPLAPARLGIDEYADVTTFAATHLRDMAPPSRPATSINPSAANGTEWMNHLSQRRVTEVPDQFAK
ncbi:hypothetical protein LMG28614_03863 [Paraburkholderia ultramafica]|uniref:Uncharacterized protein n=1 Tax=Paraburkholderia ultramafica TaxID=1544867 RepID=A0A6S7D283_9BURK|nr:hypothetical protein [Paraburkholderia ultramafica]CAB3794138.1 hypothetical protein LMG28614_03863 [Paraburkholderia ultramafica]